MKEKLHLKSTVLIFAILVSSMSFAQTWDERPGSSFETTYEQAFNGTWDGTSFYNQWTTLQANTFNSTDITSGYLKFVWSPKRAIVSKKTMAPPYIFQTDIDYGDGSNRGGVVIRSEVNKDNIQEPPQGDPGFNSEGIAFYPKSDGNAMIVQFTGAFVLNNTPVTRIEVAKPTGAASLMERNMLRIEDFGTSVYVFLNDAPFIRIDLSGKSGGIYTSGTVYRSDMTIAGTFSGREIESKGYISVCQRDAKLRLYSAKVGEIVNNGPSYTVNYTVTGGASGIENGKIFMNGVSVTTDASGKAIFSGVNAGTYEYTITAAGYKPESGSVTITNDNVTISVALNAYIFRDTKSDTWVAVDELGRSVATNEETGNLRPDKTVGLFYYIWLQETTGWNIHDISKILKGEENWGGPPSFHHYAESLYGYYSSKDEFVIRKHMQMLTDAGVDFLFLDNTNGNIYAGVQEVLLETLLKMKDEGIDVPKISWTCYNGDVNAEVETLYDFIHAAGGKYDDLIFNWQGKPLLLGYYTGSRTEISDYFTIKKSWAWTTQPWYTETQGKDRWPWLDNYPQEPGRDSNGNIEQITVTSAQHPHGRYAIGKSTGDPITDPPVYGTDGKYFDLQWSRALEVDPPLIMVTQWNEWIAQRFIYKDPIYHQPVTHMLREPLSAGDNIFIDCYSPEYSRDLEPLRTDYRDNMYMQFVDNIRKYKGTRAVDLASGNTTISINTDFSQWDNVGPVFLDDVNDVTHRNHVSFGSDLTYTNTTGRNDIDEMRVSYDADNVYFYVKTVNNLTAHTGNNWMYLLINTDNEATGWNGYDFIVNQSVNSNTSTTLKSYSGSDFVWNAVGDISYTYSGNEMHIKIPNNLLNISTTSDFKIDFKWVDNSISTGDLIDVYVDGDAAPNTRFNYRYKADTMLSTSDGANVLKTMLLYPNPVSNILTVNGIDANTKFKIFNTTGQVVLNGKGPRIDLSALKSGLYLILTEDNKKAKFIKD